MENNNWKQPTQGYLLIQAGRLEAETGIWTLEQRDYMLWIGLPVVYKYYSTVEAYILYALHCVDHFLCYGGLHVIHVDSTFTETSKVA